MPRVPHKKTLSQIARSVPLQSRRQLLDAVLPHDLEEEDLLAYTRRLKGRTIAGRHPYESVLDEVCRVLPKASDFLRRATPGQRQALGGVSMALLALTAHEGLDVLEVASQWSQEQRREELARRREHVAAAMQREGLERSKRQAGDHRSECVRMCKEVRRLLEKVADRDVRLGLGMKPRMRPTTSQIVGELGRLADLGDELIDHEVKAVRARAFLFGLNHAAVRSWRQRGEALLEAEAEHDRAEEERREKERGGGQTVTTLQELENELDLVLAQTVVLLTLVVEGFASGQRVDRTLPRINTTISARGLLGKKKTGKRRRATTRMHRVG